MLIEQTTTYSYKLKYLDNPTFDKVRNFAKRFIDDLPKELVDGLYDEINRGVDQLTTEPQMLAYLYFFGNMHQTKLSKAFENLPETFFVRPVINIIDYGCGQAIGTICYLDFLRQKNIYQKIKHITLIEPSEICLKRAALHVSKFCPDADISTINKTFDELSVYDINCEEDVWTLHIMSNVLDLLDFDLERFAELLKRRLKGYNLFVCVGPYFGFQEKDKRMKDLYLILNGDENFCKYYDKYELNANKAWTAQVRCFSVGKYTKLITTRIESLTSFLQQHGGSLEFINNPKRQGSFFFQTADGVFGAVSSKIPNDKLMSFTIDDFSIAHVYESMDVERKTVPFLCLAVNKLKE